MLNNFEEQVFKEFDSWEKKYREAVIKQDFMPLHWAYVEPELPADEKRTAVENAMNCLEFQIQFIKITVCFMTLSGKTRDTILRIKRFLSYQMPAVNAGFQMTFWGGCYPQAVTVKVQELREFDFADCWSELQFQIICITSSAFKIWTKQRIGALRRHIIDDLDADGYRAKIKLDTGKPGTSASQEICFACRVKSTYSR